MNTGGRNWAGLVPVLGVLAGGLRGEKVAAGPLFDGISLGGRELKAGADWVTCGGVIRASNGHGVYYAPGEFGDFEFTALVRSHGRANGGIFFRGGLEGFRGFEVQIYSPPNAVCPAGSIYNQVRSNGSVDYEERWFLMQVMVKGRGCTVRLDGRTVAETGVLAGAVPDKGRIGPRMHMDTAPVEWCGLRVGRFD